MAEQVRRLEGESASALDALAQRVTAARLDHVRRVKNLMVRLNTRVETIRSLLEKYLGDDDDLAELHLTGRLCALAMALLRIQLHKRCCRFDALCDSVPATWHAHHRMSPHHALQQAASTPQHPCSHEHAAC